MRESLVPSSASVAPNTLDIGVWVAKQSQKDKEDGIRSPYVQLDEIFFHVTDSAIGSVVSKLKLDFDEEGNVTPKINPFSVSFEERELVLAKRKMESDLEEVNQVSRRKSAGISR